ncbi:MAG: T9SS type A sorting domain-containing protein [Bacteroidales bacterium]
MKKLLQFFATFLLCGVLSLSVAAQENLIRNGDFTEPNVEQGWVSIHDIENTPEGEDEFWHVQFNQELTEDQMDAIEVGETYELTFDARADDEKEIAVFFGEDGGDYHNLLDPDVENNHIITLDMEEQSFTFEFEANAFDAMKIGFEGGMCDVDYSIGNVSILKKVEEGEDAGENIVNNGQFGPADFEDSWYVWYADWYDPPITVSVSINDWFVWFADWEGITVDLTLDDGWANVHNIENTPGTENWHVQFNQGLTASQIDTLVSGGEYTLTFDAKAEDDKEIAVFFGQDGDPFLNLLKPEEGDTLISLTTETQSFSFDFVAEQFDAMKLGFEGGLNDIGFSISNVEIPLVEQTVTHAVTFQADLTYAQMYGPLEDFDPDNDHIIITGEMLDWAEPGDDPDNQVMEMADDDPLTYANTYNLEAGTYEYKYFSDYIGEGWDGGEWEGGDNRIVEVTGEMVVEDFFGYTDDEVDTQSLDEITLNIFPNPASDRITIDADAQINEVRMVDILGQVVYTDTANGTRHEISVGGMQTGVYFVQLTTSGGVVTKQVQVTR